MCHFPACACIDNCCCSLQIKIQFLVFWTIVHAILGLISLFFYPIGFQERFKWALVAILTFHLIAGLAMFISLIYQARTLFIIGLSGSCVMPVFYIYLIYLPVIQIIFTIAGCRFYKLGMNDCL